MTLLLKKLALLKLDLNFLLHVIHFLKDFTKLSNKCLKENINKPVALDVVYDVLVVTV